MTVSFEAIGCISTKSIHHLKGGKPIRYGILVQGVCQSNQAFLEEIEDNLSEVLQQFEPRGVWLDYPLSVLY